MKFVELGLTFRDDQWRKIHGMEPNPVEVEQVGERT